MSHLTDKQQEVLDHIREHFSSHGFCPTTRAIQDHFGWASQSSSQHHLNRLEKKGMIQRTGRQYGLTGEIVMWADVSHFVTLCQIRHPKFVEQFLAKYPHLKP